LISYERPEKATARESAYTRCPCDNAQALLDTLSRVLPARGTVVKRREVFVIGRTRIHLDQVERLGSYVELEVVLSADEAPEDAVREADQLRRLLEIPEAGLIAEAYIDLLENQAV
jgi:predicted adenylyl cyclase CyaB